MPVDEIQYIAEFSSLEQVKTYYRDRLPFAKEAKPGAASEPEKTPEE
jgi:hypothetical protein